jgi:riboflavin kinase/FMN adenylyltransferase
MQDTRIAGWDPLPPEARGAVIALGNFDGLHPGHQAVIAQAGALAGRVCAPRGLACFEPPPRRFFQPDAPGFRLQSPDQRWRAAHALGVQWMFELPFDARMAGLSPEAFCTDVLVAHLGVSGVVVGADFCFGKARAGTTATLQAMGERLGFSVEVAAELLDEGEKAASSRIREAIARGEVERARRLLGRPYTIEAVVGEGARRGRTIGFPTANLMLGAYQAPLHGVYAVRVRVIGNNETWRTAVANFGRTPTVGERSPLLEVHVFDFADDLYGQALEVAFIGFLRPEQKFDGLGALQAQIARDAIAAREVLSLLQP